MRIRIGTLTQYRSHITSVACTRVRIMYCKQNEIGSESRTANRPVMILSAFIWAPSSRCSCTSSTNLCHPVRACRRSPNLTAANADVSHAGDAPSTKRIGRANSRDLPCEVGLLTSDGTHALHEIHRTRL